jgi:hypothetical protein
VAQCGYALSIDPVDLSRTPCTTRASVIFRPVGSVFQPQDSEFVTILVRRSLPRAHLPHCETVMRQDFAPYSRRYSGQSRSYSHSCAFPSSFVHAPVSLVRFYDGRRDFVLRDLPRSGLLSPASSAIPPMGVGVEH